MNIDQMTERLQRILMEAIQLAQAQGQSELNVEHCLKAIFEDDGIDGLWQRLGQDKQRTLQIVDSYMKRLPSSTSGAQPNLSREVNQAYQEALKWSQAHEETYMSSVAFLIGLLFGGSAVAKAILEATGKMCIRDRSATRRSVRSSPTRIRLFRSSGKWARMRKSSSTARNTRRRKFPR